MSAAGISSGSRLRRRLVLTFAAALAVVTGGTSQAQADGIQYWSIVYQAGTASGQFTSHLPDHYWHVSGRITDSTSNTNCSYFRVRVFGAPQASTPSEVYRKQVCGGATATFDVAGYSRVRDYIQISVCSNISGFSDLCSNKWLYLT